MFSHEYDKKNRLITIFFEKGVICIDSTTAPVNITTETFCSYVVDSLSKGYEVEEMNVNNLLYYLQ